MMTKIRNKIKYWSTKLKKNQTNDKKNSNKKNENHIWCKNKIICWGIK